MGTPVLFQRWHVVLVSEFVRLLGLPVNSVNSLVTAGILPHRAKHIMLVIGHLNLTMCPPSKHSQVIPGHNFTTPHPTFPPMTSGHSAGPEIGGPHTPGQKPDLRCERLSPLQGE